MCVEINGAHTLEEVAQHFLVTRERIRQIELKAKDKFRKACERFGIDIDTAREVLSVAETRQTDWDELIEKWGE